MSRLMTLGDYERELAGIEQLIEMERESAELYGLDNATRAAISALERRREDMLSEMAALRTESMPGHELSVVLSGQPIEGHTVEADFLARVLHELQQVVTSAVNVYVGTKRRTGRFKRKVKHRSTLRFAGSFSGSFGMTLEAVDDQIALDGAAAVAPAFEAFVNLVDRGPNSSDLLEALAPLGSRAVGHYRHLLEQLARRHASMQVTWRTVEGPRTATIAHAKAASILEILVNVREREVGRTLIGVLGGAVRRTGYFELELDDGEVLSGSVSPDILQDHRDYYLQRCRAFVVTTTAENVATGDVRTHHRLLELEKPGEEE